MVFVGMHPVLTQVPPKRCRSIIATFIPAAVRRPASGGPACPVPMTIASYSGISLFDRTRVFYAARQVIGDLIQIAPAPVFARFDGPHHGMLSCVKVFGCVFILR